MKTGVTALCYRIYHTYAALNQCNTRHRGCKRKICTLSVSCPAAVIHYASMTLSFVFQQLRTLGESHSEEGVLHMELVVHSEMLPCLYVKALKALA